MRFTVFTLGVLLVLVGSCQPRSSSQEIKLSIYVAASLTEVVQEFADSFQSANPHISIRLNGASSGTLARQIEQGAPADIFISAHPQWMKYLENQGHLSIYQDLVGNELVMIGAPGVTMWQAPDLKILKELLQPPRFALGDPQHVPAGIYGKQALEYLGWYKTIAPAIIPTKDVRSALNLVAINEAPLGIVYRTDAIKNDNVKIMMILPKAAYDPVVYQIGLVEENKVTQSFYDYIRAYDHHKIWERHGFIPISEP